ncbi:hypothetical protein [Arhodomonas sp. AD133]|uniref:hypothetical protein n=1 Tax=Arhodomonas sp. AD133 TaxID=3415009 RepID=UPI003EB884E5
MEPYDITRLPSDLPAWLSDRLLEPILYVEGGWEYWLQIDFPSWLDVKSGMQYDFRREVTVGSVRLDWLINDNSFNAEHWAVELKAQTHKYPMDRFVRAVKADLDKLSRLDRGAFEPLMVAAAIDETTYDALVTQLGFTDICQWGSQVAFVWRQP